MMFRQQALLTLLLASGATAFAPMMGRPSSVSFVVRPTSVRLFAEAAAPDEEPAAEEPVAEAAASEEPAAAEEPAATEEEEPEEPPEDPEIVALKEEIANQESALKGRQATLERLQEDVDKYSKAGYARRVAQMEDMKRIRLNMQSSNKDTAVATVVQNFLPVLDELRGLKEQFDGDDFGAKYSGLAGAMMSSLGELGVEEYTASVGEAVDQQRVSVVEEEYSADVPKGSIIRPVSMGMELSGNVMRLAQAVASLGTEEEEATSEEKEEGDDAPEEEAAAE